MKKIIELVVGDISQVQADAIVNAANSGLRGGGGVDGAIHRAGGPSIMAECKEIGGCPTGQAVVTTAGNLAAEHVVHAVAPVFGGGGEKEDRLLKSAYEQALLQCEKLQCRKVALPSLGTGAYGWPVERAAKIAIAAAVYWLIHSYHVHHILFVLYDQATHDVFDQVFTLSWSNPAHEFGKAVL